MFLIDMRTHLVHTLTLVTRLFKTLERCRTMPRAPGAPCPVDRPTPVSAVTSTVTDGRYPITPADTFIPPHLRGPRASRFIPVHPPSSQFVSSPAVRPRVGYGR